MTVLKYILFFAAAYTIIVAAVYLLQRNMLYFPDSDTPEDDFLRLNGLAWWPESDDYKALIGLHAPQKARGTVIVFHGNAGAAWHRSYFAHALEPLGYRVLLAEYPGYGGRPGKMNETSFVRDAGRIIAMARSQFGDPVYLLGESMGCAMAAATAADPANRIQGLLLVTPWDSLPDLAQTHYWYLPARWLVRDRYDSVTHLQSFSGPVAVAMADNDQVIPNKHSQRLYDAISSPKRLWRFENAGHNSWPTAPGAKWWAEAMLFVTSDK